LLSLAWRTDNRSRVLDRFVALAREYVHGAGGPGSSGGSRATNTAG
jgi:hypothetical protein